MAVDRLKYLLRQARYNASEKGKARNRRYEIKKGRGFRLGGAGYSRKRTK